MYADMHKREFRSQWSRFSNTNTNVSYIFDTFV